jgi:hypothetical protein
MADKSAISVWVSDADTQPIPTPSNPNSSRADLLVVTATGLPTTVTSRPAPALIRAGDLRAVMVSEAKIVGYYVLANPEQAIAGPDGRSVRPEWSQALRTSRSNGPGYCRIWDYTPPAADGTACVQHSCQTLKAFSGAPVFVLRDASSDNWAVVGVHVDNSEQASSKDCGDFVGAGEMHAPDQSGLLNGRGGLAAAIPASLMINPTLASRSADH